MSAAASRCDPLAGRYRVVEAIGAGGMGVVYRAVDERLHRDVAVKLLRPELAHDLPSLLRFANETQALCAVRHRNVVQILDVSDCNDGRPFYAMELLPGVTLARRLRETGPVAAPQAIRLLLDSAAALAAVHRVGLVHRDVKPGNFIVDPNDRALSPTLIDFGLARRPHDRRLTRPGDVIGTPPYMSPEQVAGGEIDASTDVFAWGVLAIEALTGVRVAFGGRVEEAAEPSLRAIAARGIAPAVVEILRRTLRASTTDRFADMTQVLALLEGTLQDEPVTVSFGRDRLTVLPKTELIPRRAPPRSTLAEPLPPATGSPQRSSRMPWLLAALGLGTASLALALPLRAAPIPRLAAPMFLVARGQPAPLPQPAAQVLPVPVVGWLHAEPPECALPTISVGSIATPATTPRRTRSQPAQRTGAAPSPAAPTVVAPTVVEHPAAIVPVVIEPTVAAPAPWKRTPDGLIEPFG